MSLSATDEALPAARGPLYVWLKSQCLDGENWFNFGSAAPEFDGYSWPFGLPLEMKIMEDAILYFTIMDGHFDHHVRCAWQLPWYYSRTLIRTAPKRSQANFVVENIGHWHKEPAVYERLHHRMAERHITTRPLAVEKRIYAVTPFCLIVEHGFESCLAPGLDIAAAHIVLFYTFETFIQEWLASQARKDGIAADEIIAAYEHVYTNVRPADAFPDNPAKFVLAKLVKPPPPWEEIWTTSQNFERRASGVGAERKARDHRLRLFSLRLQTHLSVALAAASYGLHALAADPSSSALVRVTPNVPTMDQLAPTWLRHMLGVYDYTAECEKLLIALARRYGTELSADPRGLLIPDHFQPRSEAERAIERTEPPLRKNRIEWGAFDRYRWSLFEPSLDDRSIMTWNESFMREAS